MKEHFQDYGIRKWAGNDLIELQSEPMEALQKLVEPYAPCILQGCEITEGDDAITIAAGLVALQGKDYKGEDCVKIVRFAGVADKKPPIYLTLECETESRVYGDSQSKAIAYNYKAVATTQEPEKPYLEINAKENKRLVDTLGITQKLDRVDGDASQTKVVFNDKESEAEVKSGNTLAKLFGGIKKWLGDIKNKLDNIEDRANNYTHPNSAAGAKDTGFYKIETDAQGHITAVTNVAKSDITKLGIPAQDTVYTHPNSVAGAKISGLYKITTDAKGHITAATPVKKEDITALGIPGQDTNTVYAHPTDPGNKHIPSGGSSGQYLKYSASGTAQWATPTATEVGALPTTGGTINGSLNVTGNIQKNGQQVYSPSNKPTPGDIGAPFLIAAGTYSVSSGMTWEVGGGNVSHSAGSNHYGITQYGIVAGCVIVTPTTGGYFARVSKVTGSVYIRIFDSNGNPAESGFYYMFISWKDKA